MRDSPIIVWFRQDLRLVDHPALCAACEQSGAIIPVFVWSENEEGDWPPGEATKWWLHQSLEDLNTQLRKHHSRLTIRRGEAVKELSRLAEETGARSINATRRYEPAARETDRNLKDSLEETGIEAHFLGGSLLFEPWEVSTNSGEPYKVFTPFWKSCLAEEEPGEPLEMPRIGLPKRWPDSFSLDELELKPQSNWPEEIGRYWEPGIKGANARVQEFLKESLEFYPEKRDRPCIDGTSRLSPYLQLGLIGPRQIWHAIEEFAGKNPKTRSQAKAFQRQLGWREFAYHLLYHFPHTQDLALREKFREFPWKYNESHLEAWQKGQTGYPVVDAGMRQLWSIGWMHNRVRMIVASFLTKDLLIPWQSGAEWFWDTLIDADLANNTLGWQWTAGCGADAAPYFRIFNPVLQGERFDPDGDYVRQWVPELNGLPKRWIHKPWKAQQDVLEEAGVELGQSYPKPIVNHGEARNQALQAFEKIKG